MTDEPNAVPRATIEPVDFAQAEPPTDRAFRCEEDGRTYRVRRVSAYVAPAGAVLFRREYELTVVALADDGLPIRDEAGGVTIVGRTRWVVDAEALTLPGGLSLEEQQDLVVAMLIHGARAVVEQGPALEALDAAWGGPAPAEPAPPLELPVTDPIPPVEPASTVPLKDLLKRLEAGDAAGPG